MSREKDAANYAIVFFAVLSVLLLIFLRNVPANFVSLLETDQENRTLREKVRDLEIRLLNASASVAENERLAKELKLSRSLPWAGSWARIINKTPADWYGSFFINKGSDDDVEVNDTVLGMQDDKAGLAGRVFEVYPKFSKVLLITNSAASAVCSIAPSGLEALVEGKGTWLLKVNYVPEQSELAEGAEITTAAGGLLFPAGVPVGRVTKVYPRESFMNFITADVTPAVDVNTLKEVFVVRRHLQREIIAAAGAER